MIQQVILQINCKPTENIQMFYSVLKSWNYDEITMRLFWGLF